MILSEFIDISIYCIIILPKEIRERYGIYTVPMHVTFGDITKDDGTFSTEEIFNYYK